MALEQEQEAIPLVWMSEDEGRALFDEQAQALLGISGAEFLRRWDAGEYADVWDDPEHWEVGRLAALISFGR